jgi:hypothetical protein
MTARDKEIRRTMRRLRRQGATQIELELGPSRVKLAREARQELVVIASRLAIGAMALLQLSHILTFGW